MCVYARAPTCEVACACAYAVLRNWHARAFLLLCLASFFIIFFSTLAACAASVMVLLTFRIRFALVATAARVGDTLPGAGLVAPIAVMATTAWFIAETWPRVITINYTFILYVRARIRCHYRAQEAASTHPHAILPHRFTRLQSQYALNILHYKWLIHCWFMNLINPHYHDY